jgi:hypothetical protein
MVSDRLHIPRRNPVRLVGGCESFRRSGLCSSAALPADVRRYGIGLAVEAPTTIIPGREEACTETLAAFHWTSPLQLSIRLTAHASNARLKKDTRGPAIWSAVHIQSYNAPVLFSPHLGWL